MFSPERSCTQTPGRTLKLVERPPCRGVRAREFEASRIRIARSGLTACSQLHADTLVQVMWRPWRLCEASRRLSSNPRCLRPLSQSVSQIRDQRPALATRVTWRLADLRSQWCSVPLSRLQPSLARNSRMSLLEAGAGPLGGWPTCRANGGLCLLSLVAILC